MRLIQISDCHLLADTTCSLYNINPYSSLESILAELATLSPDGLIVTGDISGDDSAESYWHFMQVMARYLPTCEWRVIPGNHDSNAYFAEFFADHQLRPGEGWCVGNWMLHGLDTRHEAARGWLRSEELARTAKAMGISDKKFHLLALHHHPVATHSWMDRHALDNPQVLADWLPHYPTVRLIVHGHIHAEKAAEVAQVPVLSVPSTCWQWELQDEFAVADAAPGYREIQLSPDGEWTSTVRRVVK